MSFFENKYRKKAKLIVGPSRLLAVSSMISFTDKFPALDNLIAVAKNTRDWDFFMTVAGSYAGLSVVNQGKDQNAQDKLLEQVQIELREWDKAGVAALSDLAQFVERGVQAGSVFELALGTWVLWNLKGAAPSDSEMDVASVVGKYWVHAFNDLLRS